MDMIKILYGSVSELFHSCDIRKSFNLIKLLYNPLA